MRRARILIADDHELVRVGLRRLLEEHPGWEVCGEADDGRQAIEKARMLKPDVVLMDIGMPQLNGIEATRRIRRELPGTEVCILSVHDSEPLVRQAIEAGARAYLLKTDGKRDLVFAVEALLEHKTWFTGAVRAMMLRHFLAQAPRSLRDKLAARGLDEQEIEILRLLAEGQDNRQIAGRLGVRRSVLARCRSKLVRKLGFRSPCELVRYAVRNLTFEL